MTKITYYPDYDEKLGIELKDFDQKIDYFSNRMNQILIKPIKNFFLIREEKKELWDLNVGICILICEGISALSTFYYRGYKELKKGKKIIPSGRGEQFKNFYDDFIYPTESRKQEFSDLIWESFRCSLSHGFIIKDGKIETSPNNHFKLNKKTNKLTIDLESFFNDFKTGYITFINTLKKKENVELTNFFEKRFDELFSNIILY